MDVQDKNTGNIQPHLTGVTNLDYEKAELDLLKAALKRTHKERFFFATKLYKIQQTLKKAVVIHRPCL